MKSIDQSIKTDLLLWSIGLVNWYLS